MYVNLRRAAAIGSYLRYYSAGGKQLRAKSQQTTTQLLYPIMQRLNLITQHLNAAPAAAGVGSKIPAVEVRRRNSAVFCLLDDCPIPHPFRPRHPAII